MEKALDFITNKTEQDYLELEEYYHMFKYHGEAIRKALKHHDKLVDSLRKIEKMAEMVGDLQIGCLVSSTLAEVEGE